MCRCRLVILIRYPRLCIIFWDDEVANQLLLYWSQFFAGEIRSKLSILVMIFRMNPLSNCYGGYQRLDEMEKSSQIKSTCRAPGIDG